MATNPGSPSSNMVPPTTKNGRFFENLAFRPQQGNKRKRDLSPQPKENTSAPAFSNVTANADATPVNSSHQDDTEHDEKRRRANYPEDSVAIDDEQYMYHELFGEPDPRAENLDMSLALDSMELKETVAERVVRRRKAAEDPFIPKKPNYKGAVARRARSKAPVFGLASLMGPDEQTLALALREARKPKVKFSPFVEDLPVRTPPVTRARAKKAVKEEFCVCKCPSDDTLVRCKFCANHFHPACVGKGLHGETGHGGDKQHAARLSDAEYYRNKGDFTCPSCDGKWFTKQRWSTRKFKAEKRRRENLFAVKDSLGVHGRPMQCNNCHEQITSRRYECKACDKCNLCRKCFSDPYVSSKHTHEDDEMALD